MALTLLAVILELVKVCIQTPTTGKDASYELNLVA